MHDTAGISAIGLSLPPLAMDLGDLARLRRVDPDKYRLGLGCRTMALCSPEVGVVEIATTAAERALSRWSGSRDDIGLLAVGTETALDMSRPLSAFVAERLGIAGAVRSYEVKHACYGGTLAVRQATEWKLSGVAGKRAALVIASDVALYEPGDPGEPTQGAGAVAMIVDAPSVATISAQSHAWSEPTFDFWRPVGERFPRFDGPLSLDCYIRAAERCFRAMIGSRDPDEVLGQFAAVCFHVPFPKMVWKALARIGEVLGWEPGRTREFFHRKVEPTMEWNRQAGNAYTASLWISVARALLGRHAGDRIAAFSYGSGFGAELLQLEAGPEAARGSWGADMTTDLAERTILDGAAYTALRRR